MLNHLINLDNNLAKLITDTLDSLRATGGISSLIIIIAIMGITLIISQFIKQHLKIKIFRLPIASIVSPVLCIIGITIYRWIALMFGLNDLAVIVGTLQDICMASIIIIALTSTCRSIFNHKTYLKKLMFWLQLCLWFGALVIISGEKNDVIGIMDSLVIYSNSKYSISIWDILRSVVIVFTAIAVATSINRFLEKKILALNSTDSNIQQILVRLSKILTYVMIVLITLPIIGIDVTALSVFGGAMGVGIGFGLQKIASNFLSGFIILADRSIKVGDRLVIDNHAGIVSKITMRYVVMARFDGTDVLIPNETFITNSIQNQSYSSTNLRNEIICSVKSSSDINAALRIITDVLNRAPNTLPEKGKAIINRLVDDGVEIKGYFWVDSSDNISSAANYIYMELAKLFNDNTLAAPSPSQSINLIR